MNHYPHHIGDFAKKTKGLSLAERGGYRELLDWYYGQEKPLPLDKREVYRLAIAATPAERRAVDYVLTKYFVEKPDGYHNKRADEEIVAYRKRAEQARVNGLKGVPGGRRQTDPVPNPVPNPGANKPPNPPPKSGANEVANPGADETGGWGPTTPTSHKPLSSMEVRSESPTSSRQRARETAGHKNGLESQKLATQTAWMVDDKACEAKAAALGIRAQPGESYAQLRNRIMKAEGVERR